MKKEERVEITSGIRAMVATFAAGCGYAELSERTGIPKTTLFRASKGLLSSWSRAYADKWREYLGSDVNESEKPEKPDASAGADKSDKSDRADRDGIRALQRLLETFVSEKLTITITIGGAE